MELNELGRIVAEEWRRSEEIREELRLDEFIVMPNHFHGIVFIEDLSHCRAQLRNADIDAPVKHRQKRSLGSFIAGFKAYSTKRINEIRATQGCRIW